MSTEGVLPDHDSSESEEDAEHSMRIIALQRQLSNQLKINHDLNAQHQSANSGFSAFALRVALLQAAEEEAHTSDASSLKTSKIKDERFENAKRLFTSTPKPHKSRSTKK